ncbi:496_t:CDS:2 [Racocetra fulgida]|uniref:496_t:CDS:1 n=1 Tax=Racocetra fulgida TaxID=60492 RepID=A0A9N8VVT8_9GLOM|nr:496_t:CDS:2 [Racocetra fulgida]
MKKRVAFGTNNKRLRHDDFSSALSTKNNRNYSFKVQNQTVFKPNILPTQASSTKNNTYRYYNFQNRIGDNKEQVKREEYQTDASSLLNYTCIGMNQETNKQIISLDYQLEFLNKEIECVKEQVKRLEYQDVFEKSKLVVKLNAIDKFIEFLKNETRYINIDFSQQYKNIRDLQQDIDVKYYTHYIEYDFSHQFENICEDIRALQRDIKDVKYGRDYNIYDGVCCIDGVWAN